MANRIYHTHTWMGMYGGETMKATELMSGSAWTARLHRTRNVARDGEWQAVHGVRHELPDETGRVRVTGHSGLKTSQEYPIECGRAVANYFQDDKNEDIEWACGSMDHLDWGAYEQALVMHNVDWSCAKLEEVANFLQIPMDRPMRRF